MLATSTSVAAYFAIQQRDAALATTGRLLGAEAQRRLAEPVTQETAPVIAALAAAGWRFGGGSDAWNALQRTPLIDTKLHVNHDKVVQAAAFSPDGKLLATASQDRTARLIAVEDGRELARVNHNDGVWTVAFSPDGKLLATASGDRTARVVAVVDGRELFHVTHDDAVTALMFSANSRLLATASNDGTARLVTSDSGRELFRVTHEGLVRALAFSPDSKLLATASDDKTARVTTVEGGREVLRVAHDGRVNAVAFSPDSKLLATASQDGTARLWSTDLDDILRRLCAGPGHNLSLKEWHDNLGDLPWEPTCDNWPVPEDVAAAGL
jgi:WD40 repeat protein